MSSFRYSIGDIVSVVKPSNRSEGPSFTEEMDEYIGGVYEVTALNNPNRNYNCYRVVNPLDPSDYVKSFWFDERWLKSELDIHLESELFEI